MKRAVVVLLLLVANAIFVTNQNNPSAAAPVGLWEKWRQTRNAAAAEAAKEAHDQDSLRDNASPQATPADIAECFANFDRAMMLDRAEYLGGDRL
jgi:hypothetical protein